ncbi:uncharacterized protein DS421_12g366600 [Arachis hypogaea]|nr:uncharacterized protein DS421_12g366600 [Arachis hypogaea]
MGLTTAAPYRVVVITELAFSLSTGVASSVVAVARLPPRRRSIRRIGSENALEEVEVEEENRSVFEMPLYWNIAVAVLLSTEIGASMKTLCGHEVPAWKLKQCWHGLKYLWFVLVQLVWNLWLMVLLNFDG